MYEVADGLLGALRIVACGLSDGFYSLLKNGGSPFYGPCFVGLVSMWWQT